MFRRKENNIDEIVERYLPRASEKEVEAARDRFLIFLRERHQLQQALDNFRTPKPVNDSKYVTLGYVDQLVLATIYLLRGEGSALGIAEKVNDLTTKVIDTGAVFISLDRLERARLVSTRPRDNPPKGYKPNLLFTVTPDGARVLADIRTGAKMLMEALSDFA